MEQMTPKEYMHTGDYIIHKELASKLKIDNFEEFINKRFNKLYKNGLLLINKGYYFGRIRNNITVNPNLNSNKQENLFQIFTKDQIKAFKESL